MAEDKAIQAGRRRAQERDIIVNKRFDELPVRHPKDLYWYR